jgi:hypothetical protein
VNTTAYSDARRIRPGERDHELALDTLRWPKRAVAPAGWERRQGGYLLRTIATDGGGLLALPLDEAMLRFPAAPLHGVQRLHEGHNSSGAAENFQTYRILTSRKFKRPVKRVFLLHNGLNELNRMGLYYELASHLISEDEAGTACILRPFPGHLTRFPYHAFAEQPLDRYLWDGSHLFRQFLRYMIETQWFLSAFVNRSFYRCPSGDNLLAYSHDPEQSRLDDTYLAHTMGDAWRELYKTSASALAKALETQDKAPGMKPMIRGMGPFRETIRSLRGYLGLTRYPRLGSEYSAEQPEPDLHVIGYSLGGFAAQSIFMSWPFVVDSCSTLLSGGPLRELAPTAFADPEEWQTVLHSLRYELDEAMTIGRYDRKQGQIAGMDSDLFLSFQRAFYEVFQQEYRGSFQTRLAAFRPRMLFVVGGNDPIVRPQSVIDSGPPGGINLLEIGGLGHFIASLPKLPEERNQREFWLPEIGKLITTFAKNACKINRASREDTWLDREMLVKEPIKNDDENKTLRLAEAERGTHEGALPAHQFERHLDDLFARVAENTTGYLWVLRNEAPAILLNLRAVQERARALHHDDRGIAEYCRGVQKRWEMLEKHKERISLILPWNAERILLRIDSPHGFPSQAETIVGQAPDEVISPAVVWNECMARCTLLSQESPESVWVFDGRIALQADDPRPEVAKLVELGLNMINRQDAPIAQNAALRVPSLPDCWIWVSPEFLRPAEHRSPKSSRLRFSALVAESRHDDAWLKHSLQQDLVRVIAVSRARYNPRFRGRLVTDFESARNILFHAALCLTSAKLFPDFDWQAAKRPWRQRITESQSTQQSRSTQRGGSPARSTEEA